MLHVDERGSAAIFVCTAAECGLRFPVVPGDRFAGRCPRCGEAVVEAAGVVARAVPRPPVHGPQAVLHLLLDNWRSVFNVGSAFRTADAAGVTHVHLCGITPTATHPKLAKTALGAEKEVAWSYAPNALARATDLQAQGLALWVMEGGEGSRSLWTQALPFDRPVVIAAGNEVAGVDPELVAAADRVLYVPMLGKKESLNAAVALSVAVYWLIGQAERGAAR